MMFDVSITNAFIISKSNQSLSRDTKSVKAFRTSGLTSYLMATAQENERVGDHL